MKKICLFIAVSMASWIGWKLGESYGIMTAYWLSFVGSVIGVFAGVSFNSRFLD